MQSPDYRTRDHESPFADIVRVEQCGKLLGNSVSNPDRGFAGAGVDVNADCGAGTCCQCSMLNAECAMLNQLLDVEGTMLNQSSIQMPNAQRSERGCPMLRGLNIKHGALNIDLALCIELCALGIGSITQCI